MRQSLWESFRNSELILKRIIFPWCRDDILGMETDFNIYIKKGAEFPSCCQVTWFQAYKLTRVILQANEGYPTSSLWRFPLKRVTVTLHGMSYIGKFTGMGIYFT